MIKNKTDDTFMFLLCSDAGGERRPRSDHPGHRRPQRQQDADGRHVLPVCDGEINDFLLQRLTQNLFLETQTRTKTLFTHSSSWYNPPRDLESLKTIFEMFPFP